MPIYRLLNPVPEVGKDKKRKAQRKKGKPRRHAVITHKQDRFNVISALINARTGLTSGQLWKGKAADPKKTQERFFKKGNFNLGLIENAGECDKVERCLADSVVQLHGVDVYVLVDSEATPNVMPPHLVEAHSVETEKLNMIVTVANGSRSKVLQKAVEVLVRVGQLQAIIELVVLPNVPFDIVIQRPTLKRLGPVVDFKAEEARFDYCRMTKCHQ